MSKLSKLRDELRSHGVVAPGCGPCVHFERCGGFEPELSLFNHDCFNATCCKFTGPTSETVECALFCPYSTRFIELLHDIGGLNIESSPPIVQAKYAFPKFIPLIHHGYCHYRELEWPTVALDTYQVLKMKNGDQLMAVAEDGDGLRRYFGLASSTQVVLRGVGSDRCLERYWEYRRKDAISEQMARLGLSLIVGPNFSHFLDVPGTQRLANRIRQVRCLDDMMCAGLSPVPHLNAVYSGEWRFWRDYLKRNPAIHFVAVEFETGNSTPVEGAKVIQRLAWLEEEIGRILHPLIIGGTQFLEVVAQHLGAATFIDSNPFFKAIFRQAFDASMGRRPWRKKTTPEGQPVDDLLMHNLVCYTEWINKRWVASDDKKPNDASRLHVSRFALPTISTMNN
jgi:hypothetical protein